MEEITPGFYDAQRGRPQSPTRLFLAVLCMDGAGPATAAGAFEIACEIIAGHVLSPQLPREALPVLFRATRDFILALGHNPDALRAACFAHIGAAVALGRTPCAGPAVQEALRKAEAAARFREGWLAWLSRSVRWHEQAFRETARDVAFSYWHPGIAAAMQRVWQEWKILFHWLGSVLHETADLEGVLASERFTAGGGATPERPERPTGHTSDSPPLERGSDWDGYGACPWDVWTDLHAAVLAEDVGTVETLLAGGVGVDPRDGRGRTPLHIACDLEREGIADLLVRAGADRNAHDRWGSTPAIVASRRGSEELKRVLGCSDDGQAPEPP
jgi:hypothetical protein